MLIRNKYTIETIAFVSYVLFAMAWIGATANMKDIMDAMQITSVAKGSLLSGAVTLAKILGTFIAAGIMIKLGIKIAFFAAAVMIAVGIVTPYSPNYEILLISRFVMGLGGALMIVYLNPIVLKWFDASERPIVNGINAVAFNVGSFLVLWFVEDLNSLLGGWENTLIAFALASGALSALWLLVDYSDEGKKSTQSKNSSTDNTNSAYGYIEGFKDSFNWRFALTYSGILAFYICLLTYAKLESAGIKGAVYVMGAGIVGSMVGMIYSKYMPKRLPILRWSGFASIIAAAGFLFATNPALQTASAIALGFLIFLPIAGFVTMPQELPGMTGERLTVIFSMFYSISYMIGTVALWVFGIIADMNGENFEPIFALMILMVSTFFFGSFFLPETGKVADKDDASDAIPEAS